MVCLHPTPIPLHFPTLYTGEDKTLPNIARDSKKMENIQSFIEYISFLPAATHFPCTYAEENGKSSSGKSQTQLNKLS